MARVRDKNCGKNNIKELHVWNYKIGLNSWINKKNCTEKIFNLPWERLYIQQNCIS